MACEASARSSARLTHLLLQGLLRSELFINNCLRRNFYWYSAALFGEDLLACCPSVVVLSGSPSPAPPAAARARMPPLGSVSRAAALCRGGWRCQVGRAASGCRGAFL